MGQVVTVEKLIQLRTQFRESKKKVVFTNGCFDLIHRGHIDYLTKAKAFGDILVVAINTDRSVQKIKGTNRPILLQNDRAFIVSNLVPVDYVCLFDEETPSNLIRAFLPDILIKGADWNINDVVGKDDVEKTGGRVATIEYIPNKSTTGIIRQIVERFG